MYYEEKPPFVVVTTVGDKYHTTVNYSIEESGEGFEVESVTIVTDTPLGQEHYAQLVGALVRIKYTADDEFAIARQSVADVADYMAYNAFVEKCKEIACTVLEMSYTPDYNPTLAEMLTQLRSLMKPYIEEVEDEVAVTVPALFDPWTADEDVTAGMRRYFGGKVYRCVQNHRTQADWTPDVTPALWTEISLEEWPEWVQPTGAHDAYAKDAKCSHNGGHWISDVDNNVWEPGVYGWTMQ